MRLTPLTLYFKYYGGLYGSLHVLIRLYPPYPHPCYAAPTRNREPAAFEEAPGVPAELTASRSS